MQSEESVTSNGTVSIFFPFLWNFSVTDGNKCTGVPLSPICCFFLFIDSPLSYFIFFLNLKSLKLLFWNLIQFFLKPPRLDISQNFPAKPSVTHCKIFHFKYANRMQISIDFTVFCCKKNGKNFHWNDPLFTRLMTSSSGWSISVVMHSFQ